MNRRDELAANLMRVQADISHACERVGRDPESVTLIVVSKTWPSSDIRYLHDLGVREFGESREQEGHQKSDELSDLDIRWHFIGQIQRNKAKRIAQWANVIHSFDREELIPLLGEREVCIQVNLDGQSHRGGVAPEHVLDLAAEVARSSLQLRGLMAVAPLPTEIAQANADLAFARLHDLHAQLLATHPEATWLSAGMSGDFEVAIAHGATHVRIGSSILGSRPVLE